MDAPPLSGASAFASGLAVSARNLTFGYAGSLPVLRDVTFTAPQGGITMVLGASGSGKTTLLKLIKGLLHLTNGEMTVLGQTFRAGDRRGLTPDIAYVPQGLGLVRNLTVLENALIGSLSRLPLHNRLLGGFPPALVAEATERLTRVGLGHKLHDKAYNLSGGERQRVAIIRNRMQNPKLILADEFVSQLDPITQTQIMTVVRDRTRSDGVTYIQTTHELDLVPRFADCVWVIRGGVKVLDAPVAKTSVDELERALRGS